METKEVKKMNITDFENLQDAIHYINNKAIEDKYTSEDVIRKIELVNKRNKQIIEYFM